VTGRSVLPPGPRFDLPGDPSLEWTRYLAVDADLEIRIDTAAGEHATGRLTGHGHRLRLDLDRPEVLIPPAGRTAVTALASQLTLAHLRAELYGPRGRIAAINPARTSRVARVLTGSPHITVDRLGWALVARTAAPTIITVAVAGATALLAAALLIRRCLP
jgi:hypothetical protein